MEKDAKKEKEKPLQRSVFYWADFHDPPQSSSKTHSTITAEEVAVNHGVTRQQFCEYLDGEIESTESCFSLPFTLVLVISYAMLAIAHDEAPSVNSVEDSIAVDIFENANFAFSSEWIGHKGIDDVNSHADFWSWMTRGFAPLIFQQTYFVAENRNLTAPDVMSLTEEFVRSDRGFLLMHNRIVLGVRMRQERYGDDAEDPAILCAQDVGGQGAGLQNVYGKDCVGGGGYDYRMDPEEFQARITTNPQREEWLYVHDDYPLLIEKIDQMEKDLWLDDNTRKVEISLPVYNAEYGIHCLFYCNFFFSRGGHIWKDIIALNSFDFWFKNWYNFVYDGAWFACLSWIIVTEGREILHVVKENGLKGIKNNYASFWNMVDWISVVTGLALIAMGYYNMTLTAIMNTKLEELGLLSEELYQAEYREKGKEYIEALETEVHYYYYMKMLLSCYPMVIVMRLFKAFGAQPRLALVTNTLKTAQTDLLHFLLIVLTIFFSYMIAATTLFGREVKSFTTPFRSTITCFRAMMGDFDFPEMVDGVGRTDSFVWFFPFVLLIMLLLLNMLMAIIMDAYAEVVAQLGDADTLVGQARKIMARMKAKRAGELVDLTVVQTGLARQHKQQELDKAAEKADGLTDNISTIAEEAELELIFVDDLKQIFPEMKAHQAKDLIVQAVKQYYEKNKTSADLDEVTQLLHHVNHRTKKFKQTQNARLSAEGQARNHPEETLRLLQEVWTEIDDAREDLREWMPEDQPENARPEEDLRKWMPDEPLPKAFVNPPAGPTRGPDPPKELAPLVLSYGDGRTPGSRSVLPELLPMYAVGRQHVPDIVEGGQAEVLGDERLVMEACRRAGIDTQSDELRRAAIGRVVNVIDRDDRDGTCRVQVPGVGFVWLAVAAFAARPRDPHIGSQGDAPDSAATAERAEELNRELEVGNQTVAEAMEAVKELQERLQKTRDDKVKRVQRFHELRQKAVALSKENHAQKQRLAQDQAKLRKTTVERDKLFDQAKAFAEENQEFEAKAQERNGNRRR